MKKATKAQWRVKNALGRMPGGGADGVFFPPAEELTLDSVAKVLEEMNEIHRDFYTTAIRTRQALHTLKMDLGGMGRLLRFAASLGESDNDYTLEAKS
jgi:hypothetical protein